ncbi:MAG: exodeoxyribonuclease V subunit gamma [Desulfobacterales bacterium]|nr:exodeoxyribonuclease V subunit gamma [Desulfobacteraceae bacterium]MBT7086677.1 exodeoxyribonuclease V subunit gamma [Desulfobacterales bacterium]
MTTLNLYTGNRLEELSEALCEVLSDPLGSPIESEVIITQNKGIQKWISMEIAGIHGICANTSHYYPNDFIDNIFNKIITDIPTPSPYYPEVMTWKIMNCLPSCINRPGFEVIKNYLDTAGYDLKCYQLSKRIADNFDQYIIFRPEMIFKWEGGKEKHWQAELWRELVKDNGKRHRAALFNEFILTIKENVSIRKKLPERISVFGVSALPPFHMHFFSFLSDYVQVNLYLMNPCSEYWGDIFSNIQISRTTAQERKNDLSLEELYIEKGNSLLGSMGILGRDFFELVSEMNFIETNIFKDPGDKTLLQCIQSDILNLRNRLEVSDDTISVEKKFIDEHNKPSINVHSCHSPMREIEVLNDNLLEMFENDPHLKPHDIIVMTPDIELYAPYIQAVFDISHDDKKYIPYHIAEKNIINESQIVKTFFNILNLYESKFKSSEIYAILENSSVHKRFGISENDLKVILRWINDTRISWGIDSENRKDLGLPPLNENTWKAGLERLLLGYAMPGYEREIFAGILPYDYIEGKEAAVLGKLLDFTEKLFVFVKKLGRLRTLKEWSENLNSFLDSFFITNNDTEREKHLIRQSLKNLSKMEKTALFHEKIDVNVIKYHLELNLSGMKTGVGSLSGNITFSPMITMRSLPFKVICIIGMDINSYPRQNKVLGFDLIAKKPKQGDRSRRNDDRYLFLESILSARNSLYISYTGQSIHDNSMIPPSVLVSELIDYIKENYKTGKGENFDNIITKHKLQAFNTDYFHLTEKTQKERLFSYSLENFNAAKRLLDKRKEPLPFFTSILSEPENEYKTIDINDLCLFFTNPSKYLLNKRLGIYLEQNEEELNDNEIFDINGLEKYKLEQHLLQSSIDGINSCDLFPIIKASGRIPHGSYGENAFNKIGDRVTGFKQRLLPHIEGKQPETIEMDIQIADFSIYGIIKGVYQGRSVQYRHTKIKTKDLLKTWIYHLALNSVTADKDKKDSIFAGLDSNKGGWNAWEFQPVESSKKMLQDLLYIYFKGLLTPLKFFPETSFKYAHELIEKKKQPDIALKAAEKSWGAENDSGRGRGESDDLYYSLCFKHSDPFDDIFHDTAVRIFRPLLQYGLKIL